MVFNQRSCHSKTTYIVPGIILIGERCCQKTGSYDSNHKQFCQASTNCDCDILNKDGVLYIYEDTSRDAYAGGHTSRFIRTTTVRKTVQNKEDNQLITYEFGSADNNCSITLNSSKQ